MITDANTNSTADHSASAGKQIILRVFDVLDSGDVAALETMLAANPGAASSRDDSSVCLLAKAFYTQKTDAVEVIARHLTEPDMIESTLLGQVDRIKLIVGNDSEAIHRHSPDGFAPLHLACFFKQPAVAMWLLDHGADANVVSANPPALCPIHSAAAVGAADIAQSLIEHGADVNRKQSGGFTAIHAAANLGDMNLIEILLNAGADKTAKTDDGKTAADIAGERAHADAVKRLS